jgi:SAM-dependent methyltransferase
MTGCATESRPCPFGCPPDDEPLFCGRDRLHGIPGEFSVVRCRRCGLMRTDPRPMPQAMGAYYPDDYGPYLGSRIVDGGRTPSLRRRVLDPLLRGVFRFNTHVLPSVAPGRMLEIGCASGAFLAQMAAEGWQVRGIEFSAKAAAAARAAGYDVFAGPVDAAPAPNAPYDLIVGWMVVEHLFDPVQTLGRLAGWTRPGGWLAISVPDAGALEFRLFKGAGYALQLPTHLYHFTPRTITMLLERSGWRVERIFHQRVLNNLMGSIGLKLEDWGAPPAVSELFRGYPQRAARWALALYPIAWLLAALGQTGRMTVLARKDEVGA